MNRFRSTVLRWLPLFAALAAYDVYLLLCRLPEVQGNVEAQFIIITPGFLLSHVALRHQANVQHDERMVAHRATDVQLAEHRDEMAAVVEKVGELHDWHLKGKLPPDTLKP